MSAYFSNYCKLNEKVYKKIVEHELNVMNDKKRFNEIVSSVDRNIDNNVKIIKELSENTIIENKKSINLIANELAPIQKELDGKITHGEYETKIQ